MKGILLAGGKGTRLYPCTKVLSKQLIPIYDKPLIYYPLSILLLAEIREILIISTPEDISMYRKLLGDGKDLGVSFQYKVQPNPLGLAEAFLIGEEFIGTDSVCLILGDNVFYGQDFSETLHFVKKKLYGATIFGYPVTTPEEFGVIEFDKEGKAISLEEKPTNPKSMFAIPGLYFYNNDVIRIAKEITPSKRGELEITAINSYYLAEGNLHVQKLGRGMAWLDTGSPNGMLKASNFVETIQSRQGFYIACIEEICWRMKFITTEQLTELGNEMKMTAYGKYILELCNKESDHFL